MWLQAYGSHRVGVIGPERRLIASEHPLVERQRLVEASDALEEDGEVIDGVQRVGVGRAIRLEAAMGRSTTIGTFIRAREGASENTG
jgi:hypothetical protein